MRVGVEKDRIGAKRKKTSQVRGGVDWRGGLARRRTETCALAEENPSGRRATKPKPIKGGRRFRFLFKSTDHIGKKMQAGSLEPLGSEVRPGQDASAGFWKEGTKRAVQGVGASP